LRSLLVLSGRPAQAQALMLAQRDVDRALDVACFRFSALADVDHDDGSRADQAGCAVGVDSRRACEQAHE
jgi:hypothetical protein